MLPVVTLLIVAGILLATTRLTRLITEDRITLPMRRAAIIKHGDTHWIPFLLHCPWCISPYVATIVTTPSVLWGLDFLPWHLRAIVTALLIPTAAQVAGELLSRKE